MSSKQIPLVRPQLARNAPKDRPSEKGWAMSKVFLGSSPCVQPLRIEAGFPLTYSIPK